MGVVTDRPRPPRARVNLGPASVRTRTEYRACSWGESELLKLLCSLHSGRVCRGRGSGVGLFLFTYFPIFTCRQCPSFLLSPRVGSGVSEPSRPSFGTQTPHPVSQTAGAAPWSPFRPKTDRPGPLPARGRGSDLGPTVPLGHTIVFRGLHLHPRLPGLVCGSPSRT